MRQRMSVMVSAAAWGLGQWESMEGYVGSIPKDTMDGAFYQALMHIHHRQIPSAQKVSLSLHLPVHVCISVCIRDGGWVVKELLVLWRNEYFMIIMVCNVVENLYSHVM